MVVPFTVFEFRTGNDQLITEFHKFFYKYNLTELFSNEHRVPHNITVTDNDVRSVVNYGSYSQDLIKFANLLAVGSDNKKQSEALFKILHDSKTFQKLMNIIRRITQVYEKALTDGVDMNLWNIVFYTKSIF